MGDVAREARIVGQRERGVFNHNLPQQFGSDGKLSLKEK
jgi:hypothetical protein